MFWCVLIGIVFAIGAFVDFIVPLMWDDMED